MTVIASFDDLEQIVVLLLDVGVTLVLRRRGVVRHVAARRRAVGRHVQEAVGVPYQVVGVARTGGEERQNRAFGKGVVKALEHGAVGILHRGNTAFVEHQKLTVAHGDRIILGMAIRVIETGVLAIVGHRFGGDIKAPRRRVTGRIDFHHRGIQQTLRTVTPGAIRLAHGRVGALN